MPLSPGHSDEVREKNIREMIAAGHEPRDAVGAAYANQRKYKKMAEGGMIAKNPMTENDIEESLNGEHERGLFELQGASHEDENLGERPETNLNLAHAISRTENMAGGNGAVSSDIDPDETTDFPESYFAEEAKKALRAKKKKQTIIA
jgi:hypothetical protein